MKLTDKQKEILYEFRQLMREIQEDDSVNDVAVRLAEELESKSYWLETEIRSKTHGDNINVRDYLWF